MIKEEINLYIELQKQKLDQIVARNIRISLDKPICKATSSLKKNVGGQILYDTHDKSPSTVLANSPALQYRMQVSSTFTVIVIFCPLKQILGDLKQILQQK